MSSRDKKDLVSVIIPVHNARKFLRETIESVLAQTYQNFEIIIVDDASTDDSVDIANSYKDERIRVVSQNKLGVSSARNKGASVAKGEWLTFCDADDVWTKNKLTEQAFYFQKNMIVYSDCRFMLGERVFKRRFSDNATPPAIKEDILARLLTEGNFIPFFTVAIRKKDFVALGGFDSRLNQAEDLDLWIRAAEKGLKFITTGSVHGNYRLHDSNSSGLQVNSLMGYMKVLNKYLERSKDKRYRSICVSRYNQILHTYLAQKRLQSLKVTDKITVFKEGLRLNAGPKDTIRNAIHIVLPRSLSVSVGLVGGGPMPNLVDTIGLEQELRGQRV